MENYLAEKCGDHVADGGHREDEAEVCEAQQNHSGEQGNDERDDAEGDKGVEHRADVGQRIGAGGREMLHAPGERQISYRFKSDEEEEDRIGPECGGT